MDSQAVSLKAYWELVRDNRNFRRLWFAQITSEIGDWFYTLAIYSMLLEFTGRAASVGLAVVLQVLPQTLIGPTAGVVNDRASRRRVMIFADLARFLIVLGMLLVRGRAMAWLVYPLLLLETVMYAFFEPGRSAVVPNIVGAQKVLAANTLSSTTWSVNFMIGSMLGGLMAALLGRDAVFLFNALTFLVSAWLIRGVNIEEPHLKESTPLRPRDLVDFSPVLEGINYVRSDKRLLVTVLVKGGLGLLGSNWVIYPILGERVFPVAVAGWDAKRAALLGMSLLMGFRGVGSLLGPFVTAPWAGAKEPRLRLGIFLGFLCSGLGYLALAAAPSLPLACLAVIVAHAGGSLVWVFSTTLLQLYTEDRFRGRVFSADYGFCFLAISLTAYAAGLAIDWGMPVRELTAWSGMLMLLPAGLWALAQRIWTRHSPNA